MLGEKLKAFDLKEAFGDRFKVLLDPVAKQEDGGTKNAWLYIIPCKYGHIYPYSEDRLCWWCEGSMMRSIFEREITVSKRVSIIVLQWAEASEAVFQFQPKDFDFVAAFARPRRRRRLSRAERERLITVGREYRFQSQSDGAQGETVAQDSTNEEQSDT